MSEPGNAYDIKLQSLEGRLERHISNYNDHVEDNRNAHAKFHEKVNSLSELTSVDRGIFTTKLDTIVNTQMEMQKKLDEVLSKPAKRWDSIVEKIIWLIVAGICGGILTSLMPWTA